MFLSRASGQCARFSCARPGAHVLRQRLIQRVSLPRTTCSPNPLRASVVGAQRATYAAATSSANRYPENLNVFNSGPATVVASGTIRIVCLAVFGYGALYSAPYILLDGVAPWYMAPLMAFGAALPILATGVLWGGYVLHINILLPSTARRSKDELMRFISNLPPTAIVQIKSMWFRPWPVTKEIFFEDFRRLPRSKLRLSNLENIPKTTRELPYKNPMWNWLAKKVMGTYFVNVSLSKDRSRAPGIWNKIWQQIPMAGEAHVVRKEVERRAVLPSNRSISGSKQVKGVPRESTENRMDHRANRVSKMSPKRSSRPTPKP